MQEIPEGNEEDLRPHDTVALLIHCRNNVLVSWNRKHSMLTLPVGKVRENESLVDACAREMKEELGVTLQDTGHPEAKFVHVTNFTAEYEFAHEGKVLTVPVHTYVFTISFGDFMNEFANGNPNMANLVAKIHNNEKDKCGGIFWASMFDIASLVDTFKWTFADCLQKGLVAMAKLSSYAMDAKTRANQKLPELNQEKEN